jgi:hypothetical protein
MEDHMPKNKTQLTTTATALAVKLADKQGPLAPSEVLGATHFLLEAGIYASQDLPTRAENEDLNAYLRRLDPDERGHLESLSMAQGHRLADSLRAAALQLLYLHKTTTRWIAPATAQGFNDFRPYVHALFSEPDIEDKLSHTTVKRMCEMVEIVELLYTPVIRKRLGLKADDLPSGAATCLLERYSTWSRVSHHMIPLLAEINEAPTWNWAHLEKLSSPSGAKRHKRHLMKRLRRIIFDSAVKGGNLIAKEIAGTGAGSATGIEPWVVEPEVAATWTPRQKAALEQVAPWIKIPGDFTPDQIEHQVRLTWWPLCPICHEEHDLSIYPDTYWCTHKDEQILFDDEHVAYDQIWHMRYLGDEGITGWVQINDPGQHDDWKMKEVELPGLAATMFTFWDNKPAIYEEVAQAIAKETADEQEFRQMVTEAAESAGFEGTPEEYFNSTAKHDEPFDFAHADDVVPTPGTIDYSATYIHNKYPELLLKPNSYNGNDQVLCIILREDLTYPSIVKHLEKHTLVDTVVGLKFSFMAADLRRVA